MSTLFGDPAGSAVRTESSPPPWLAVRPVLDFNVGPRAAKRGRGATPTVHAALQCAENPVGRTKLKLRFRRLSAWSDARIRTALVLLAEYFERLSTFDIVTDERARLWCEALRIPGEPGGDYTASELRAAIQAKAASLAPDRKHSFYDKLRKYGCPTPESFIVKDKVAQWRERSAVTQQQRAAAQRAAVKGQRAAAVRSAFELFPDAIRARLESAWDRRLQSADALRDWRPGRVGTAHHSAEHSTADSRERWRPGLPGEARRQAVNEARIAAVRRLRAFFSEHGAGDLAHEPVTEGLLLEFQIEALHASPANSPESGAP